VFKGEQDTFKYGGFEDAWSFKLQIASCCLVCIAAVLLFMDTRSKKKGYTKL